MIGIRGLAATAAIASAAALGGCAHRIDPATLGAAQQPVTCTTKGECAALWSRAVSWVALNSKMRISTQTDELIQTYAPPPGTDFVPQITVSLLKNPDGGGRITFAASECRLVCQPGRVYMEAAFKRFVLAN